MKASVKREVSKQLLDNYLEEISSPSYAMSW